MIVMKRQVMVHRSICKGYKFDEILMCITIVAGDKLISERHAAHPSSCLIPLSTVDIIRCWQEEAEGEEGAH
jgi:hypothetical protein